MNKSAILHIPNSQYAFANSETSFTVRLRGARNDLKSCVLYYGDRACRDTPVTFFQVEMERVAADELFDYYSVTFESPFNRICYYFKLESDTEWTYYYAGQFEKKLADYKLEGRWIEGRSEYNQYPVILKEEVSDVPEWFKDAIVYNIFPDSFASGAGVLECSEREYRLENERTSKSVLGGTIAGIRENLDYIQGLGFDCIYLNPIFTAGESHKYDVMDYYQIDPCMGTNEEFHRLVEDIHKRNMHIIIDGVFNHCSWYFFAFDDVVRKGRESEYADWFCHLNYPVIRGGEALCYDCFAYEAKMPKLNTSNPQVQAYFEQVGRYWIREFGVDGWRLDVANEVDKNFWRKFREGIRSEHAQAVLIGEVWENSEVWLRGDMFDSTMNYDFRKHCRDFFALELIDAETFGGRICQMLLRYPTNYMQGQLNLLDSHDVPRFMSLCNRDVRKWKLAFLFLALCPGVPSVFYGDEQGIDGIAEHEYRKAMSWNQRQERLETFVKQVLQIRKEYLSSTDRFKTEGIKEESRCFSFQRIGQKKRLHIVLNAGSETEERKMPAMDNVLLQEGAGVDSIQGFGYGVYVEQGDMSFICSDYKQAL